MSEIHVSVQNTPIEVTAAIENPIDITVASGPASSNLDFSQFLTTGDAFNLYYRNSNPSGFVSSLDAGSVLSINNLSGVLQITGLGNVIVNHDGQIIQISGAESINHIFTGSLTGIINISGLGNITVHTGEGNFIYVSGDTSTLATITSLYNTGSNLYNYINNYSGNSQIFTTGINPTGFDQYFVHFPLGNFSKIPKIITTIEVSGDSEILYLMNVRNRTISGYQAVFSDIISENGVVIHTIASIND